MPGWEYRLWEDGDTEMLVRQQFPQYLSSFQSIRRGVVKADIARYMYMYVYGGYYFDTDYKMFKEIDGDMLNHSCVLPVSRLENGLFILGNAVLGSTPGYRLWAEFLDNIFAEGRCGKGLDTLAESEVIKTTGPDALTRFFRERQTKYEGVYLPPRAYFHPAISCRGLVIDKTSETLGAHLCWGSWRSKTTVYSAVDFVAMRIGSII
jgi:hypothetical protein